MKQNTLMIWTPFIQGVVEVYLEVSIRLKDKDKDKEQEKVLEENNIIITIYSKNLKFYKNYGKFIQRQTLSSFY